jgi:hypothetical protein
MARPADGARTIAAALVARPRPSSPRTTAAPTSSAPLRVNRPLRPVDEAYRLAWVDRSADATAEVGSSLRL